MVGRTVKVKIFREGSGCAIPVPFDPVRVFGKVRAPVRVTLNGYTFRSTIVRMHGHTLIPLRRSNREAAGVDGGDLVEVKIEADTAPREVAVPADLERALDEAGLGATWNALSYTHRREWVESVEGAKKPETRERRIGRALDFVRGRA